jgi:hypothetical protein
MEERNAKLANNLLETQRELSEANMQRTKLAEKVSTSVTTSNILQADKGLLQERQDSLKAENTKLAEERSYFQRELSAKTSELYEKLTQQTSDHRRASGKNHLFLLPPSLSVCPQLFALNCLP